MTNNNSNLSELTFEQLCDLYVVLRRSDLDAAYRVDREMLNRINAMPNAPRGLAKAPAMAV